MLKNVQRKPTKQQILIGKFVTVEFSENKFFWPRETKIANNLIKKYTFEFLDWLRPPQNHKVYSLSFFLTTDGQDFLSAKLVEFHKENNDLSPKFNNIELSDDRIGEDFPLLKKRPKSLLQFIEN